MDLKKKLFRSREDRVFFGVCGGVAEYFEIDSVIVRLIFVILALSGGAGLLLYILAAIIIPEKEDKKSGKKSEKPKDKRSEIAQQFEAVVEEVAEEVEKNSKGMEGRQVFGIILIGLGAYFMLRMVFPWFDLSNFWWVILILIGFFLLFSGRK